VLLSRSAEQLGQYCIVKIDSTLNVSILAVAYAFAFSATPLVVFISSLVGIELAPSAGLATLPVAAMIIGVVAGIWPVSKTTAYLGRKVTSILFLWVGVGACLLCSVGIQQGSFTVFCVGTFIIGTSMAAVQQFRYVAIECMDSTHAATAASIILSGGIFAAFAGPELAVFGKDLTYFEYQGSFWIGAACIGLASLIIIAFKPPLVSSHISSLKARPLRKMLSPGFCLAICSGAVSYSVMSFIMTATPISMHHNFMHSLADTKFVIQSHITAMFLPSLISPLLFRWFGSLNMMKFGLAAFGFAILVGNFFTSVPGFWVQLVLLGIGWNFLFVAGTAMLSSNYQPEDRLKAQAINDGLMFGMQAIASVSAGIVMARISWAALVSIGLLPLTVMLLLMVWYGVNERKIRGSLTTPT
jgi:MFS family permease